MSGENLGDVVRRLIPEGAVLLQCTHNDAWWCSNGQGYTLSMLDAGLYDPASSWASNHPFYGEHKRGDHSVKWVAVEHIDEPRPGSIVELMAKRISELESEVATLRAILASVPAPEDEP
jgi:hypothetical protein